MLSLRLLTAVKCFGCFERLAISWNIKCDPGTELVSRYFEDDCLC